jgi:CRP-like cAMP-binding protein
MKTLKDYFGQFPFLTTKDLIEIQAIGEEKRYKKGAFFIHAGTTQRKLGILLNGLTRAYAINSKGDEISMKFRKEGEAVACHDSIFYNQPSRQNIEFLEPSTIFVFDYKAIEDLAHQNTRVKRLKEYFFEQFVIRLQERLETFLLYSAQERYQWLMDTDPGLIQRVQQKHLASFLGVTPVSLSRLRNQRRADLNK